MYLTYEKLFSGKVDVSEKPKVLDYLEIEKEGITVRVYGVLHALGGGTNVEYVNLVNKTIAVEKERGVRILSEKSMKMMYKGVDQEVEDWIQMGFKECFLLGLKVMMPHHLANIGISIYKEKKTKRDYFHPNNPRMADIGGSAYFHSLSPTERRKLAGFPTPIEYLKRNIERKSSPLKYEGPEFPANGWKWLTVLEPFVNIPLRSIHMLDYAVLYAQKNNLKEIALFVGEIHNSDIQWYAQEFKESDFTDQELKVVKKAQELAKKSFWNLTSIDRIKYLFSVGLGSVVIFTFYVLAFHFFFKL